jgi:acyl dehydratase
LAVGDELPPLRIGEMSRAIIAEYSRVAHDPNPMHTDEALAQSAGYPTVFAQGMLGLAYLTRYLVGLCGVGNLASIKVRFKTMTWPGETVSCHARVASIEPAPARGGTDAVRLVTCDVHTQNQDGVAKVVGTATVRLRGAPL